MNEQAKILVDKIRDQVQKSKENSTVIDVVPHLTYATLDVICGKCPKFKVLFHLSLNEIINRNGNGNQTWFTIQFQYSICSINS